MDGISLILGGLLGCLAGWAFSTATNKQRDANDRLHKATEALEKMNRMEDEAKNNKSRSFSDTAQSFLLYTLGVVLTVALVAMLITTAI